MWNGSPCGILPAARRRQVQTRERPGELNSAVAQPLSGRTEGHGQVGLSQSSGSGTVPDGLWPSVCRWSTFPVLFHTVLEVSRDLSPSLPLGPATVSQDCSTRCPRLTHGCLFTALFQLSSSLVGFFFFILNYGKVYMIGKLGYL